MSLLRKKTWWQVLLNSRLTIAALAVIAVALSFAVYDRYAVEREMLARKNEAETDLQALTERQAVLKERVEYLNNDQGMEAEIRRHFDVAREGEQVVILLGDDTEDASFATSSPLPPPKHWWNIFSW